MSSINRVILIGRLGQDPEVKFLDGGNAVCNFSMATSETWKDKQGEKQEKTQWHRVVAWGKTAELAGKYLAKGRQVCVEGSIEYREYTDKEGVKKYSTDIKAQSVTFLGGKSESAPAASTDYGPAPMTDNDDSVPF